MHPEEKGEREEGENGRDRSKDAIVWQGLLVKPENKLWTSEDNEVHATKYDDALSEKRAIVRACGSGLRMCCTYIMRMHVCVYIREDITSQARIFTRNMSFSRVIVSEIKLRHALLTLPRCLNLLDGIFNFALSFSTYKYFAIGLNII